MTGGSGLLLIAALLGFALALLIVVRRYVAKQAASIAAHLDECDFVVLEAAPEQLTDLRTDFEQNEWRFHDAKPTSGRGLLYTFVKSSDRATSLSQLLGIGLQKPLLSHSKSSSNFQMKIKAHGPARDLHA